MHALACAANRRWRNNAGHRAPSSQGASTLSGSGNDESRRLAASRHTDDALRQVQGAADRRLARTLPQLVRARGLSVRRDRPAAGGDARAVSQRLVVAPRTAAAAMTHLRVAVAPRAIESGSAARPPSGDGFFREPRL